MGVAGLGNEHLAAMALLALGLASSAWMYREAMTVTGVVQVRERQLAQLRTMVESARSRGDMSGRVESLRGLFHGHEVMWLQTSSGPVLTLTGRVEERR